MRLLWRSLNRRVETSPQSVRSSCGFLLVAYTLVALARYDAAHTELAWVRLAVSAYALAGVVFAPRLTWKALRAYTVGICFLLPLDAAYVNGVLGNRLADLPLTALATFVPLVFLSTARDLIVATLGLLAGHALLLHLFPSAEAPFTTLFIVLGGAVACGGAVGLMLLFYRSSLQDSLAQLEAALRAKSEFLNTMSHELRSPLHVIIGYADLLRDGEEELGRGFVAERVRTSALELLQLVENTMNVARLEAGRISLRLEEFQPAEVMAELADGIRALPEGHAGVPVEWAVAPGLPTVRLDRLKLKEIVQNLVSNALKFTAEGRVTVSVDRDGARLRIAVADTGLGIPPEAQSRIFEVFERVEASDGHRPGVGLGLYIVKSLVELMHGTIALESRPGHGSRFTVHLPLRLGADGPEDAPRRPSTRPAAVRRRAARALASG
jgi:signal transduction histidine kinase